MSGKTSQGKWVQDNDDLTSRGPEAEIHVPGPSDASSRRKESKKWAVLRITPTDAPFLIGWRHPRNGKPRFYMETDENDQPKATKTDIHGCLAIQVGRDDIVFIARPLTPDTSHSINLEDIRTTGDPKLNSMPRY